MPDAFRNTAESLGAHPPRNGFCAAICIAGCALLPPEWALAQDHSSAEGPTLDAYLSALFLLDRHEIAALALTLGIIAFAVTTAIALRK